MAFVDDVKSYCRIDASDTTATAIINAAILYVTNAIEDKTIDETNPLFALAVKMLAAHWYDNRGVADIQKQPIPLGVASVMSQLSNSYGVI